MTIMFFFSAQFVDNMLEFVKLLVYKSYANVVEQVASNQHG